MPGRGMQLLRRSFTRLGIGFLAGFLRHVMAFLGSNGWLGIGFRLGIVGSEGLNGNSKKTG